MRDSEDNEIDLHTGATQIKTHLKVQQVKLLAAFKG